MGVGGQKPLKWVKSPFCDTNTCVEFTLTETDVRIRNSARPNRVVRFTHEEWIVFLAGVLDGGFDID